MSTIMLENSLTEVVIACRTCLTTKRKLYSIHEYNFSESYMHLSGKRASPYDGLPQYICNYCATLLLKFMTFRLNSQQAQSYLQDVKIITPNALASYHPVTLNQTEIKIIDTTQTDLSDNRMEDPIDDQENNASPLLENNDNIKDETQEVCYKDVVKSKKSNKYFELDKNLKNFQEDYNVQVLILTEDQQKEDLLERKLSSNYLQSPYKCELCYKGFMDEESLHKHFLYQHDPSRGSIVCELCSFRYKDKRGLNQHVKKSHRLKFACKQCSYISRTTFNAKEHFKMHTGHIHTCRLCGKSYEKLSSHLTHLRIHHPSAFIWCDVCGEAFIGQFGLNAHKKRAHRHLNLSFGCPSCDIHFTTENALSKHKTYNNCSQSSCVHCGECFEHNMDLREHLIEKHRDTKIYECEKCPKKFRRQSLHAAHYKRAHVDCTLKRKDLPCICEVCGKTLPNKCVLLYHQRNHTGERPYECPQCNKGFTMKRLLQSHLRVHSSDRPYSCKMCPKTFKGLSALRSHEHVHTDGPKRTVPRNKNI